MADTKLTDDAGFTPTVVGTESVGLSSDSNCSWGGGGGAVNGPGEDGGGSETCPAGNENCSVGNWPVDRSRGSLAS